MLLLYTSASSLFHRSLSKVLIISPSNMQTDESHSYRTLPESHIRLLEFDNSSQPNSISYRFREYDIDQCPAYHALLHLGVIYCGRNHTAARPTTGRTTDRSVLLPNYGTALPVEFGTPKTRLIDVGMVR